MASSNSSPSPLVLRLARLAPLLGGAALLLADSADPTCTEGSKAVRFDARFTSTCPVELAPEAGEVHLDLPDLPKEDPGYARRIVQAFRVAGFDADDSRVDTNAENVCTPTAIRLARLRLTCGALRFDADSQQVTCSTSSSVPLVLSLGRRDGSDAGAGGDGAAEAGTLLLDASAPDASTAAPQAPAPTSTTPEDVPPANVTCTLSFQRLP